MKIVILFTVLCATLVASAEKQEMSRYQSIIDRQMFGPLPKGFDPTKSPDQVQRTSSAEEKQLTQEQEKLQSAVHFSVMNVNAEGVPEVGFTDNSDPKAPKHFLLKPGEKVNDGAGGTWEVREADPQDASATLVRTDPSGQEVELEMRLGDNTAGGKGGSATKAKDRRAASARPNLLGGGTSSLRARRQQREAEKAAVAAAQAEEMRKREEEREARAAEEKAQHEQEREEQRKQLQAIQEELRKARESRPKEEAKPDSDEKSESEE